MRKKENERETEREQENPAFLRSYKIFLIALIPPLACVFYRESGREDPS